MELPKAYDPKLVEDKIYKLWEKSGFFNPDGLPEKHKIPYVIMIAPPNITGSLHMGHALENTISDILIRFYRMNGRKALFLPGTDHASIATQNAVEKQLKKEGLTRFDLGKEKFVERIWQWKNQYGEIILSQLKKLGVSCDWSRTRFTLDENYERAVQAAFWHYYQKGWIYQGEKTVNWCPRCDTSLSDLEITYKEEVSSMYYIKYGPLTVATTRPETKLGDTAVAVNPEDERYRQYIGKAIDIQTVLGPAKMRVIGDESIDINFGTGAMKVTPAHDLHDFELGEKYGLEKKQVIGPDGKMTGLAGKYAGMKVLEARKKIIEDMEKIGILEKTEPYTHNVAVCERCGAVLEPLLSKQWFLKMNELASRAIEAVRLGKVKFTPKKWEKTYFDWLKNVKDWCISRQLWWGHKIPIKGVDDVLDTWFSAALWPFATLGWPSQTRDLKTFYPTDFITSAREITNLWIVRMIFSGFEFMEKEPFKNYHLHATVLTREGKRMSKSLGTGIDPINLIEKYGADATRFGIVYQLTSGQDIRFAEDNIIMGRKFCNKIWNASRFAMMQNLDTNLDMRCPKTSSKIIKQLNKVVKSVSENLESYQFGAAARALYDFFWHDFCDEFIEESKKRLHDKSRGRGKNDGQEAALLLCVLLTSLKLLHPFIPFITEEIYQTLPLKKKKKSLMIEDWPEL